MWNITLISRDFQLVAAGAIVGFAVQVGRIVVYARPNPITAYRAINSVMDLEYAATLRGIDALNYAPIAQENMEIGGWLLFPMTFISKGVALGSVGGSAAAIVLRISDHIDWATLSLGAVLGLALLFVDLGAVAAIEYIFDPPPVIDWVIWVASIGIPGVIVKVEGASVVDSIVFSFWVAGPTVFVIVGPAAAIKYIFGARAVTALGAWLSIFIPLAISVVAHVFGSAVVNTTIEYAWSVGAVVKTAAISSASFSGAVAGALMRSVISFSCAAVVFIIEFPDNIAHWLTLPLPMRMFPSLLWLSCQLGVSLDDLRREEIFVRLYDNPGLVDALHSCGVDLDQLSASEISVLLKIHPDLACPLHEHGVNLAKMGRGKMLALMNIYTDLICKLHWCGAMTPTDEEAFTLVNVHPELVCGSHSYDCLNPDRWSEGQIIMLLKTYPELACTLRGCGVNIDRLSEQGTATLLHERPDLACQLRACGISIDKMSGPQIAKLIKDRPDVACTLHNCGVNMSKLNGGDIYTVLEEHPKLMCTLRDCGVNLNESTADLLEIYPESACALRDCGVSLDKLSGRDLSWVLVFHPESACVLRDCGVNLSVVSVDDLNWVLELNPKSACALRDCGLNVWCQLTISPTVPPESVGFLSMLKGLLFSES